MFGIEEKNQFINYKPPGTPIGHYWTKVFKNSTSTRSYSILVYVYVNVEVGQLTNCKRFLGAFVCYYLNIVYSCAFLLFPLGSKLEFPAEYSRLILYQDKNFLTT